MYARLWWKDARQFWPIWLVLIVAAAFTQWMILAFVGRPARFGGLGIAALALGQSLRARRRGRGLRRGTRNGHAQAARLFTGRSIGRLGGESLICAGDIPRTHASISGHGCREHRAMEFSGFSHAIYSALFLCMIVPVSLGWGLFWSSVLEDGTRRVIGRTHLCRNVADLVGSRIGASVRRLSVRQR